MEPPRFSYASLFWLIFAALFASDCRCAKGRGERKVDVHCHFPPQATARLIELMDHHGVDAAVNLSGGVPGRGLEEQLKVAQQFPGRIFVFAELDWYEPARSPGYGKRMANSVEKARQLGAKGIAIPQGLGLGFRDSRGALIAVDDPELDPIFEKAGELGMPVAIHSGAPLAFWDPPIAKNERYEELSAHPEFSLYGRAMPWQALFKGLEQRIARHPKCTFLVVHFGSLPEYPDRVAKLLDHYPNVFIDIAGRIPELGRHPSKEMHRFFEDHSDRILFGTDLRLGTTAADIVLSSGGSKPPDSAELDRFFAATWRYLETHDKGFAHPTPIQGHWTIDGVDLSSKALARIYHENAERVLQLPATRR